MVNITNIISNDFKLSKIAAERIKFLLIDEEGSFFRISVLGGGCSGFQYNFSFEDNRDKDDYVFNKTLVDKNSLDILNGSVVDFQEELIGDSFTIKNPKASSSCGCGLSFSV
jgi:iron-sulfur cluster insertion protein